MVSDGMGLKEAWEFQHWSNPVLRKIIDEEFVEQNQTAWEVIAVLNKRYPGAWELLRGELVYSETKEA